MSSDINTGNNTPPPSYDIGGSSLNPDSSDTYVNLSPSEYEALTSSAHHLNNISTTSTDELQSAQADTGVDLNTGNTSTSGSTWSSTVGKTLAQGTPVLPSPTSGGSGAVPRDIAGNPWFSNSGYIMAHLATLQQEAINANMALEIGLQGAEMLKVEMQANIDNANLTKEEWDKQADIAKWQMISAAVSLGITVGSMVGSLGVGAVGGLKGGFSRASPTGEETSLAGKPPTGPDAPPKSPSATTEGPSNSKSAWNWSGAVKGASDWGGGISKMMVPISQMGQSSGQIMTGAATMKDDIAIGLIKQGEIESQAAADMLKNAVQTCSQEAHDALERNDNFRQFLKSVDDNRLQYSSRFTPG